MPLRRKTAVSRPPAPLDSLEVERVIRVRGARTHNLQNVDLDLALHQLTVVTGLSGSGKSSLVFDTLFATGYRRFLLSQLRDVGMLLRRLPAPDVDEVSGLPPVIGVSQDPGFHQRSIRSTLGTLTGLDPLLHLLFARMGVIHCPVCGQTLRGYTIGEMISKLVSYPARTKAILLVEFARNQPVTRHSLDQIQREGFIKLRLDGELVDISDLQTLDETRIYSQIEIVVDRIIIKEGIETRLRESLQNAVRHSGGNCLVSLDEDGHWIDHHFALTPRCGKCQRDFPALEPELFNFNSPQGACPECHGLGVTPIQPGETASRNPSLPVDAQNCPACKGSRLNPQAHLVHLDGHTFPEVQQLDLVTLASWMNQLRISTTTLHDEIKRVLLPGARQRLAFLSSAGLGYLALSRSTLTLSGGEFQRARLGAALGAGLSGICYLIDEPTTGLHPVDRQSLIHALRQLIASGNSVITVEHDLGFIEQADWVIDLGPGAGVHGGKIVAQGPASVLQTIEQSPTGQALRRPVTSSATTTAPLSSGSLRLANATTHNLKHLDVTFPLQTITVVAGVSGSGKSSLVMETLVPLVKAELAQRGRLQNLTATLPDPSAPTLTGSDDLQRLIVLDQWPLGKSPRAVPATVLKIWSPIRALLARTRIARQKGYPASRFSFLSKEGQCPACQGRGYQKLTLARDASTLMECPRCLGKRFNPQTLAVRFHEHSLADLLQLSCDQARDVFANLETIRGPLDVASRLGLGYLRLGQPAHTLSGGEAQRLKLAAELSLSTRHTLFILDEPTTGLHALDVEKFLKVCRELQQQGNTILILEHHRDVIVSADHLIELGPTGGPGGGHLLFQGPPAALLHQQTPTALALKSRSV